MTAQRRLIFDILSKSGRHMTAQEIYKAALQSMPQIALGTVYRNLSLMTDEGEIGRLPLDGSPDLYEANAKTHDHMICEHCHEIRDVLIPELGEAIEYQTGVRVKSYRLTVKCICVACQKKR